MATTSNDAKQLLIRMNEDLIYLITNRYLTGNDIRKMKNDMPDLFAQHEFLQARLNKFESENQYECLYCGMLDNTVAHRFKNWEDMAAHIREAHKDKLPQHLLDVYWT